MCDLCVQVLCICSPRQRQQQSAVVVVAMTTSGAQEAAAVVAAVGAAAAERVSLGAKLGPGRDCWGVGWTCDCSSERAVLGGGEG